uniref:Uncharacterized protein n=1 Tax=Nothoprocta perdicaria TaxID=30464 RepID=A0A8C6YXG1_NOTPE
MKTCCVLNRCSVQISFLGAEEKGYDELRKEGICPYCFQWLVPDNHRVRLRPKMKVTPRIERVLRREARNHKLNMKQAKLLRKYRDSRSVLVAKPTYYLKDWHITFLLFSNHTQNNFEGFTSGFLICR